jgi:hypothetical protein
MSDTFKPPAGAAVAAKRALRWIEEGHAGSGFTATGHRRATQLANREQVSLETVKRMYSFFARHEVDKQGKDFANITKPSAGRVAWDAWGGDAGYSWAKRIVESMEEKSVVNEIASAFFGITKSEKQVDGTLIVTGIATDSSLDVDEQICDTEWLKTAMPEWFRWGNIREQHSNIAAGVATEYENKDNKHWITARVVDPASVKKVESGVLKGFSIGIRAPRVVRDEKAAGGRIVDGQIVEVSLVDRPANPACTLSLAKTVDGSLQQVELLSDKEENNVVKGNVMDEETTGEESTEVSKEGSNVPSEESSEETTSEESTEESTGEESSPESTVAVNAKDMKMCKECGKAMDDCKCAEGGYSATEKAAEESSQEVGEESSQEIGEESSRKGGVAGVAGKSADDRLTHIEEMLTVLLDTQQEIAKAVQREDIAKSVHEVTERLSVVEKSATVNAPVRMAMGEPKPVVDEKIAKAAEYRNKAMASTNPVLANGYMALALELENSNK